MLLLNVWCISVIYKFVTLTTLYFTEMWWPCFGSLGGFLNNVLLLTLFVISFSCYLKSVIVGPGFLPLKWKPVLYNYNFSITQKTKLEFWFHRNLKKTNSICSFVQYVMGTKRPVFIIVISVLI